MDQLIEEEDQNQQFETDSSAHESALSQVQTHENSSSTVHESDSDSESLATTNRLQSDSESDDADRPVEHSKINIPQSVMSTENYSMDSDELSPSPSTSSFWETSSDDDKHENDTVTLTKSDAFPTKFSPGRAEHQQYSANIEIAPVDFPNDFNQSQIMDADTDTQTQQIMNIFDMIDVHRNRLTSEIKEYQVMDGSGDQAHSIDPRYMIGWKGDTPKKKLPAPEHVLEDWLEVCQLQALKLRAQLEEKDRIIEKLTKQVEKWKNLAMSSDSPSTSAACLQENQGTAAAPSVRNYDVPADFYPIQAQHNQLALLPEILSKLTELTGIGKKSEIAIDVVEQNNDLMVHEAAKSRIAELNEVALLQRLLGDPYWRGEFTYIVDDLLNIGFIQAKTSTGERKLKAELLSLKIKDAISEFVLPAFYTKDDGKPKLKLEFVIDINREREVKKSAEILTLKIKEVEDCTVKTVVPGISSRMDEEVEANLPATIAMNPYIISSILPVFSDDTTSVLSESQSNGNVSQNNLTKDKFKKSVQVVVDTLSRRKGVSRISKGEYEIWHDGHFKYITPEPFFKWSPQRQQGQDENYPRVYHEQDGEEN